MSQIVLEELCVNCYEPLLIMGDQAYCTTCQPHLSFVVGYENAAQYSYTRVEPGNRVSRRSSPPPPPASGPKVPVERPSSASRRMITRRIRAVKPPAAR